MTQFYIGGEWVAPVSGETMPVMNPANGERLGTVALGNAEDVDRAVAAATAAFDCFSLTSKADRLALLRRIREESERRLEELAQAMRMEMGAPITFSREMQADAPSGTLTVSSIPSRRSRNVNSLRMATSSFASRSVSAG